MDGVCSTYVVTRDAYRTFVGKSEGKSPLAFRRLFCLRYSMGFVCDTIWVLSAIQYGFCLRYNMDFVCDTVWVLSAIQYGFCLRYNMDFVCDTIWVLSAIQYGVYPCNQSRGVHCVWEGHTLSAHLYKPKLVVPFTQ
jgi:hypothetical protein